MPEPLTITEAAGFIRRGELTPSELLEQCLARIDKYEARVQAWVYLDRDGAREQAERLTAELKRGENRGPLHGISIGIKDIIDVFDMPTGCGSKLWANSFARRDATVVQRLRQAGAIIMGKTVTTAFASFDPPVTRNPWNLERTPGGSSSGSAAAVACGMCLGALATQTGGSITRPASYCGVYSIKPTYGRVSVDGVLPLAPSMDHVGAMANCVRDLAYIFEVIAGYDPNDQKCAHLAVRGFDPEWQKPQSIARLGGMFHDGADPASSQKLLSFFRVQPGGVSPIWGTAISDVPPPAELAEVTRRHNTVMAVEAAAFHATRLAHHPEDYPPKITALLREGLNTPAPNYAECKSHQDQLSLICDNLLESFDALVTLATPGPAPTADTTGNPVFNSPWSYTGLPTISLPFAWSPDGLPLAIQLIGPRFREQEIFSIAAGWESREFEFERRPLPL